MDIRVLACIVLSFLITGNLVASQTCLSKDRRLIDKMSCLDGIYGLIKSDSAFWFGKCSSSPKPSHCDSNSMFDPQGTGTSMVKRILYNKYEQITSADQLKYLNVTYTSPSGKYSGCDHEVETTETKIFTLDPLDTGVSYKPWDAREFPQVTWEAEANEKYTLLVVDAGFFFMHGVYTNIPGNDISKATVVKKYHGPQNAQPPANPYAFLLLKQNGDVQVAQSYKNALNSGGRTRFNISSFRDDHDMTGPVGWNWLMANYDVYSVQKQRAWGSDYCSQFVEAKMKEEQHAKRPFIDENDLNLQGFIHLNFEMPNIDFTICCKTYNLKADSVTLDPIGDGLVTAAGTRASNDRVFKLTLTGFNVNYTTTLAGKLHTLVAFDPDVPFSSAGTVERPLLHWMRINIEGGDFSTGEELVPYRGPAPPDQKPHFYYFFLYEQQNGSLASDVNEEYAGNQCADRLKGICNFNINPFVQEQGLKLVAATWMQAVNDPYVNYTYLQRGQKERTLCNVDLTCTGSITAPSVCSIVLLILSVTLFTKIILK